MAEIGDFSEYTPRNIDLIRQLDEEELVEFIYMMHELVLEHSDLTEESQKAIIIQFLEDNNEKAFKK